MWKKLMVLFFILVNISLVLAGNDQVDATITLLTSGQPTAETPLLLPTSVLFNESLNCSGSFNTGGTNEWGNGIYYRWYNDSIIIPGTFNMSILNLSNFSLRHPDKIICSIKVNDSVNTWSNWSNSSELEITNTNVTYLSSSRIPSAADTSQQINYTYNATDNFENNITAYCQLYNGTPGYNMTPYGDLISASLYDSVSKTICSIYPLNTTSGEYWVGELWSGDGYMNTSKYNTSNVTIGSWVRNITSHSHNLSNVTIEFTTEISSNYTIDYSLEGNYSNLNYTSHFATYDTSHQFQITLENLSKTFYYNITTYTERSNDMEIWGINNLDYNCLELWACSGWSYCVGNYQTRTCIDLNHCNTFISEPSNSTFCGDTPTGGGGGGGEQDQEIIIAPLFPGEPITCGNGIVDPGESFLNCNKDIIPNLLDVKHCIESGEDCIYYDIYLQTLSDLRFVILFGVVLSILIFKFNN